LNFVYNVNVDVKYNANVLIVAVVMGLQFFPLVNIDFALRIPEA
jgi:hypothetical protein